MARRRGERVRAYVSLNANLKYGFETTKSVHDAYKSELGQTTYAGAAGVFFGANAPKPFRASKTFATGTISSFCSYNKVDTLRAAEWLVTRKRIIRGIKTAGRTRTVFVEMPGGWKYAWNITSEEADLGQTLGFTQATASDADTLIWGVNEPKPPRATKQTAEGSKSTYVEPKVATIEAAITAGYSVTSVNYDLIP